MRSLESNMDTPSEIKLSLLDNSHAFLNEAVTYAISAQNDVRKWQFAILNLVQSMELGLKSLLHDIHPILIFENIDAPKHTVSPTKALDRLNSRLVANAQFTEGERRRINIAIDLRNRMMHSEFTLNPEYAAVKFFELFGFVSLFQARHFDCEIEDIVTEGRFDELIALERMREEQAERAVQRIADEGIDSDFVLQCCNCDNETFVMQDDINTCYTCRYKEEVRECRKCCNYMYAWQMEDFSSSLDIEYCEGQARIASAFGYDYEEACSECMVEIKEDIDAQIHEIEDYERRRDEYYREFHRP